MPGNLETVPGKSQTFIRFYKCIGDLFKSGTQEQEHFFLKPLFSGSMLVFKGVSVSHNEHLISVATNRIIIST